MGSALFLGELPSASGPLRLDLAAAYSLTHFAMFTLVGGVFAVLARRLRERAGARGALVLGLTLALSAGFATLDALLAPNLVAAVGLGAVLVGNVMAAGAMTAFYAQAFALDGALLNVPTTLIGDSES